MKINFGKYSGKEITCIINDTNYKEWLLKQSFFKEKYPEIYNAVINYKPPEKKVNFFELVEKSLNNDILEKIGEYFKLPENNKDYENCNNRTLNPYLDYLSFSWRNFNDYDLDHNDRYIPELTQEKESIIRVFNHRKNIYNALMIEYQDNKFLKNINSDTDNNIYEYTNYWKYNKYYHGYNKFLTTTTDRYGKINYCCNAECIFDYLNKYHFKDREETIKFMDKFKLKVGKYKNIFTFQDVFYFLKNRVNKSDNYNCIQEGYSHGGSKIVYYKDGQEKRDKLWSVKKYMEWFKENIIEEDPYNPISIYYNISEEIYHNNYNSRNFYN